MRGKKCNVYKTKTKTQKITANVIENITWCFHPNYSIVCNTYVLSTWLGGLRWKAEGELRVIRTYADRQVCIQKERSTRGRQIGQYDADRQVCMQTDGFVSRQRSLGSRQTGLCETDRSVYRLLTRGVCRSSLHTHDGKQSTADASSW